MVSNAVCFIYMLSTLLHYREPRRYMKYSFLEDEMFSSECAHATIKSSSIKPFAKGIGICKRSPSPKRLILYITIHGPADIVATFLEVAMFHCIHCMDIAVFMFFIKLFHNRKRRNRNVYKR